MLIVERVAVLRNASLFRGVRDHALADVAQIATEVEVATGESIIDEGADDETWMFVIADGRAQIHTNGVPLDEVGPGTALGELAVLDAGPRSAAVTATEPCLLLRIDGAAFREVMFVHPDLMSSIITTLVRMVRRNNEALSDAPRILSP